MKQVLTECEATSAAVDTELRLPPASSQHPSDETLSSGRRGKSLKSDDMRRNDGVRNFVATE